MNTIGIQSSLWAELSRRMKQLKLLFAEKRTLLLGIGDSVSTLTKDSGVLTPTICSIASASTILSSITPKPNMYRDGVGRIVRKGADGISGPGSSEIQPLQSSEPRGPAVGPRLLFLAYVVYSFTTAILYHKHRNDKAQSFFILAGAIFAIWEEYDSGWKGNFVVLLRLVPLCTSIAMILSAVGHALMRQPIGRTVGRLHGEKPPGKAGVTDERLSEEGLWSGNLTTFKCCDWTLPDQCITGSVHGHVCMNANNY